MTSPADMRGLCAVTEHIVRLFPQIVAAKILKQSEADYYAAKVRAGVESTLTIAMQLEAGELTHARTHKQDVPAAVGLDG